jgi:D-alanyl-D-alanine carboxypeptidase/D-alanyl-D-alanine-endopeptidase (penicillin-binding protein 4)
MEQSEMKVLATLLAVVFVSAAAPPSAPSQIDAILRSPELARSRVGIKIVSLDNGRTIYQRDTDRFFGLASVGKIFSTGGALALLGPNFRYHTYIYRDGALANGVLHGDVILRAAGDPNLSGRIRGDTLAFNNIDHSEASVGGRPIPGDPLAVIASFAKQIAARGIRRVTGRVIVDASLYPEGYVEFGSHVITSPVSVNDNWIDVWITPGAKPGAPATLSSSPGTAYVRFVNHVRTAAKGAAAVDAINEQQPDGTYVATLSGNVPAGKPYFLVWAVPKPSLFAATVLTEALRKAGVTVAGSPDAVVTVQNQLQRAYKAGNVIAAHTSPPLREDIKFILKVSQNLHAWMTPFIIGKVAGHAVTGLDDKGYELIRGWMQRNGLDTKQASLEDGAGTNCFATPDFLVAYLKMMTRMPYFKTFHDSLPVIGRDGSLAEIMPNAPVAGHMYAKPGTGASIDLLNGRLFFFQANYAGYMTTSHGKHVIIVVLTNNTPFPDNEKLGPILNAEAKIANAVYLVE